MPRVGHADLIDVGKAQGEGQVAPAQVLPDLIDLAADVARRPAHEGQELPVDPRGEYFYDLVFHGAIIHTNRSR